MLHDTNITIYRSVPGKCPLPGKRPCTTFQGVNVAASIQTYGRYIPGKRRVYYYLGHYGNDIIIA